ncbi:hypothetical protein L1987_13246 [Smallanthus sonchifolius]|uniref:Uncharacterized protein n=1 Tax=Smallanthus sonchifolius TaxID=185202 RepID=A0ACB9JGD5_9ASTR|nr:hypothetical protein L1987_13246 [Smallanthus sonchifolius]
MPASSSMEELKEEQAWEAVQRLDSHDTHLKNQQSAFQDLKRTVGGIAQSLKDRQGGPSSSSNASVMAVSVRSVEKKEVVKDDFHSIEYGIPSVEEVKKVYWRARFAVIDAKIAEERESPPVVEEESADEEEVVEMPAEKAEEEKKGAEMEHGHFLDMFKQLKVNLPLIETLQRMPKYGKFLKDLLSNKKKLDEVFKVSLSEQFSTVVQNKMPKKLGDLGHFTIPCLLGSLSLHHAFSDLGASINLMPYSLYQQLGLGEPQLTRMSISLADRSVKYPRGIMENLLVKVGKFVFPVDFVILDMEVEDRVPHILGRPFLRTAKAMIDVFDGKLTLRVGDESIIFDATQPWTTSRTLIRYEPDEYDDEVPDDLLEMMAEFDENIGKTPSVGKLGFVFDSVRKIVGNEVPVGKISKLSATNKLPRYAKHLGSPPMVREGQTKKPT